jgi:hypothetical protein
VKKDTLITVIGIAVVIAICVALAAVRGFKFTAPEKSVMTSTDPTEAAKKGDPGKVVMRVNGEPITERQFTLFVQEAPEQARQFYATPEGRQALSQEIVKLKSLEQEGRRLGVDKDPELIDRLELDRVNLTASAAIHKLVPEPTEAQLRAEYEKQKKSFEGAELSHILVAVKGGPMPAKDGRALSPEQAMQKAQVIRAAIAKGADFRAVAQQASDDVESGQQGGFLGPIAPGMLPPELRVAVEKLKEGEVSEPVRTQFGVHILKVGKKTAQPFEAVKGALKQNVQRGNADAALTKLEKAAKVERDPSFFPPAVTPPTATAPIGGAPTATAN